MVRPIAGLFILAACATMSTPLAADEVEVLLACRVGLRNLPMKCSLRSTRPQLSHADQARLAVYVEHAEDLRIKVPRNPTGPTEWHLTIRVSRGFIDGLQHIPADGVVGPSGDVVEEQRIPPASTGSRSR